VQLLLKGSAVYHGHVQPALAWLRSYMTEDVRAAAAAADDALASAIIQHAEDLADVEEERDELLDERNTLLLERDALRTALDAADDAQADLCAKFATEQANTVSSLLLPHRYLSDILLEACRRRSSRCCSSGAGRDARCARHP
jgi:hypothetical protein